LADQHDEDEQMEIETFPIEEDLETDYRPPLSATKRSKKL